jgi:hypothetical protein
MKHLERLMLVTFLVIAGWSASELSGGAGGQRNFGEAVGRGAALALADRKAPLDGLLKEPLGRPKR